MKKQLSQVLFLLVVTMLLHSISFRHMQAKKNALFSNTANKMIQLESQALNFKNQHPQSLDATSIQHTISELQFLKPSKVENIFQEDACSLFIALRTDQLNWLHITWHSKFSWISLTQSPTRSKTQRLSLESTLTSFMQDMYLTDISIPDKSNRVVRLGFSEKISQSPKYNLFVEIMGAKANIALVDARSSLILACGYQVSAGRTKGDRDAVQNQRSLQVSSKYEAPPAFVPDVKLANKFELTKALMEGSMSYYKINSLLLRSSSGISPNIVHSILRAANIVDSDDTQCLTESQAQIVMDMYLLWDASYHNPETTPFVTQDGFKLQVLPHFFQVRDRDGSQKSLYSPIQFIHKSNPNPSVSQSRVVDFLREYYTAAYRSYLFDSLRSECDRELQRKLKKADRLLSKLEAMERERT